MSCSGPCDFYGKWQLLSTPHVAQLEAVDSVESAAFSGQMCFG